MLRALVAAAIPTQLCDKLPVMLLLLPALLLLSTVGAASAQEPAAPGSGAPAERLRELQREIEAEEAAETAAEARAAALRTEVERLRQHAIFAAGRAQELERRLSVAEIAVAFRRAAELRQRARLSERNAQLTVTLGALQRIALQPQETLLASPGGALETARSALLLSTTVPELERRAAEVRRDLQRLASLTAATAGERDELSETAAALAEERLTMAALTEEKTALQREALAAGTEAARRAARLAAEAEDLQDLLERLATEARERRAREAQAALAVLRRAETLRDSQFAEAETSAPAPAEDAVAAASREPAGVSPEPPQIASLPAGPLARPGSVRPFPAVRSSLRLPVAGHVAVSFGEPFAGGIDGRARGIYMEPRPQAQVVAPFDGQVAFAGRFRRYGLLLIIEHDGRYHSLLSGLERIDAVVGQWVLAGEPIGVMGGQDGSAEAPRLYYELRRDSQPINPLPWLAMDEERARG